MKKAIFYSKQKYKIFSNTHVYNLMVNEYNELEKKCIEEKKGDIKKGTDSAKIRMPICDITYSQFLAIQIDFIKLLVIEILKGYKFIFPYLVAKVGIIRKERSSKKKQVNWFESNKLRKELLEKGEEPAQWTKEKDKFDNPKLNNNNLWMVFFTDKWKIQIVYLRLKIMGTGGRYKYWQTLHWQAIFVKPLKVKINQMVNSGKINVDLIDNLH